MELSEKMKNTRTIIVPLGKISLVGIENSEKEGTTAWIETDHEHGGVSVTGEAAVSVVNQYLEWLEKTKQVYITFEPNLEPEPVTKFYESDILGFTSVRQSGA
jgi:hypothetical protein